MLKHLEKIVVVLCLAALVGVIPLFLGRRRALTRMENDMRLATRELASMLDLMAPPQIPIRFEAGELKEKLAARWRSGLGPPALPATVLGSEPGKTGGR
jgi:hypothetical protein